jgi:hypothetical protein
MWAWRLQNIVNYSVPVLFAQFVGAWTRSILTSLEIGPFVPSFPVDSWLTNGLVRLGVK